MRVKQGKKRLVHAEIFNDPKIAVLSDQEKGLIFGLIINSDDDGRLFADPGYLKSLIWPISPVALKKIKTCRDKICGLLKGFRLYKINGIEYIQLMNFKIFNNVRPEYYKPSLLPPYDPRTNEYENKVVTSEATSEVTSEATSEVGKKPLQLNVIELKKELINKKNLKNNRKQANNDQNNEVLEAKITQFLNLFFTKTQLKNNKIPKKIKAKFLECIYQAARVLTEKEFKVILDRCIKSKGVDQAYEYYMKAIDKERGEKEEKGLEGEQPTKPPKGKSPVNPGRPGTFKKHGKRKEVSDKAKALVKATIKKMGKK